MTISKQNIIERLRLGQTIELNFAEFSWLLLGLEKFPEIDKIKFNIKIDVYKITLSPVIKFGFLNPVMLIFAGISLNILYGVLWRNRNLIKK